MFQGVINQLQLGFALSADRKRTASAHLFSVGRRELGRRTLAA